MLGWTLYAADNEDRLGGSISVNRENQRGSWVLGNARQDRTSSNIMSGVIFRYNPAVGAYRCPADRSTVIGDQGLLRTRSYTLSGWMNSSQYNNAGGWGPSDFKSMPQKLSQIVHPPPTGTFVFIDEHEDSIDDGLWNTDPGALAVPGEPGLAPGRLDVMWGNFPADRHNQAANIAFADGHVIRHRWLWLKRKWNPNTDHEVAPENQLDRQDLIYTLTLSPVEHW